ncbi:MAG: hypothetical protein V8S73_05080 [Lachnospiraceae bacterium]
MSESGAGAPREAFERLIKVVKEGKGIAAHPMSREEMADFRKYCMEKEERTMQLQKLEIKELGESPLTRFLHLSSVAVIMIGPLSCVCFASASRIEKS